MYHESGDRVSLVKNMPLKNLELFNNYNNVSSPSLVYLLLSPSLRAIPRILTLFFM